MSLIAKLKRRHLFFMSISLVGVFILYGGYTSLNIPKTRFNPADETQDVVRQYTATEKRSKVRNQTEKIKLYFKQIKLKQTLLNLLNNTKDYESFSIIHDALQSVLDDQIKTSEQTEDQPEKSIVKSDTNLVKSKSTKKPQDKTFTPCKSCTAFNYSFIIEEPNACDSNRSVDVVIMIFSAPKNHEARTAIRDSWGSRCRDPESGIKCVFVLADSTDENDAELLKESRQHHDIIQMGFHDSYRNLTYKTILSCQWVIQHCSKARYVMKTDDDMFVNTLHITTMLKTLPDTQFAGGRCWNGDPDRNPKSKWYASIKDYPGKIYPPMCSGTGYIMTYDVVESSFKLMPNVPFIYLEDVFMAMAISLIGVIPKTINDFHNDKVPFNACKFRNNVITSHGVNRGELEKNWREVLKCTTPT